LILYPHTRVEPLQPIFYVYFIILRPVVGHLRAIFMVWMIEFKNPSFQVSRLKNKLDF
jgi:hypothetical protein